MLKCYYHPQRDAAAGCINCRHLICSSCRIVKNGKSYCPRCYSSLFDEPFEQNREEPANTKLVIKKLLERFSKDTK